MSRSYLSSTALLTLSYLLRTFRDKTALFFTFLFPLMFLLVFGALNTGGTVRFDVAIVNRSDTAFSQELARELENQSIFKLDSSITTLEQAREQMGRGYLDTVIELPAGFGAPNEAAVPSGTAVIYFEEASPQAGQTVAAIIQQQFTNLNRQLTGITAPLSIESRSAATNNLSNFDYVFAGLLGFTLLSIGIFGMAQSFPAEKKTGSFRRLQVAPVRPSQLILANGLSYLFTGIISVVLMTVAALLVFDFNMRGSYVSFCLFSMLGIITMFGFGLAIGAWAKNENQAAPLTNLMSFPLMFLSGVFFPRFLMPEWLQSVTYYLPLTPIIDGLRLITAEGKSLLDIGPQIGLTALWAVVIYLIAIRLFRWQ
jgi:ABC-2 type transport system permease protein